jgi:hypothetical protein
MAYFPKQTINFRDSGPGEFVSRRTGGDYEGPIMETSTGRFYAGRDPMNLSTELVKKSELSPAQFGFNREIRLFNDNKPYVFNKTKKLKTPPSSRIGPTDKDYERGYYTRYYMYRTNDENNIFEISEKTFRDAASKKVKFDRNLYKIGSLVWALKGDVISINYNTLEDVERRTSSIQLCFPRLNEFYRKPQPKKGNENKYNIPGRYYENDENNPIPSNLPPTYQVGMQNKCGNCIHFKKNNPNDPDEVGSYNGHCAFWKAQVRSVYWCKSYAPTQEFLNQSFQDYLEEKRLREKEELRKQREGKLLTGIGKALAEALKARGITDIEGADIEGDGSQGESGRNKGLATPSNKFKPVNRKSRTGEDRDIRREDDIGKRLIEKELRSKRQEINFDPQKIKLDPSGRQLLEESGLPKGKVIGERIYNKFDKKHYKWNGKKWKPMRMRFGGFGGGGSGGGGGGY